MTKYIVSYVDVDPDTEPIPDIFNTPYASKEDALKVIREDMDRLINEFKTHNPDADPYIAESGLFLDLDFSSGNGPAVYYNITQLTLDE